MSLLNARKRGLAIHSLVIMGSGDIIQDILADYVAKLELKPNVSIHLRLHFEKKI